MSAHNGDMFRNVYDPAGTGGQVAFASSLGTMAAQNASAVNITGGSVVATTVSAGSSQTFINNTGTNWGTFSPTAATSGKDIRHGQAFILRSSRSEAGSNAHAQFYDASGGVAGSINTNGSGSTSYSTTSDERLKTDPPDGETDFESGDALDAIGIARYAMSGSIVRGFRSAQALHAVFPEAVTPGQGEPGQEGFVPWTVDYSKLVPLIIRELQRLRGRERQAVQAYQALRGRTINLEAAVAALQETRT